jgi:hypothetical protein
MNDLQKARNFVEFTHGSTRYRCAPETALQLRKILDKPKKHKIEALSSVNLTRQYPAFLAGHTTTADYIARFNSQFDGRQHEVEYTHADRVAPTLDPTRPEVLEELDPDYTPTATATKRQTAADLRKVIREAYDLLKAGDVDTAQCVLSSAL